MNISMKSFLLSIFPPVPIMKGTKPTHLTNGLAVLNGTERSLMWMPSTGLLKERKFCPFHCFLFRMISFCVFRSVYYLKVLYSIVCFNMVFVVYSFFTFERSTDVLLHNISMLSHSFTININLYIASIYSRFIPLSKFKTFASIPPIVMMQANIFRSMSFSNIFTVKDSTFHVAIISNRNQYEKYN